MPNYDFQCLKCEAEFEELTAYDETGKYSSVICPHCGSKKKEKLVTGGSFNFSNPVGTDRWNSSQTGHDYRYKYNAPNVRKQREYAEKNSHMGRNPYPVIDDISSGKHFGEVK